MQTGLRDWGPQVNKPPNPLDGYFLSQLLLLFTLYRLIAAADVAGRFRDRPTLGSWLAMRLTACKATGRPPAFIPCRAGCGKQFPWQTPRGSGKRTHHARAAREARNLHEKVSRGTTLLSRTCPFGLVLFPEGISDEWLVQHRKECTQRPPDAPSLNAIRNVEVPLLPRPYSGG